MKTKYIKVSVIAVLCSILTTGCGDSWLDKDPKTIITEDQVWNNPDLIISLLANYYNRLPHLHGDFNTGGMAEIDDAMWSGTFDQNSKNDFQYGDDYGQIWEYGLIRDINLALENIEAYGDNLKEDQKKLFIGELKFQRAFVYFEMVKRMGGVPLIKEQLIYDFSGDPSHVQVPRAKEEEIYDFIYEETEAIKNDLAGNNGSKSRANTYAALALQSRAMLYAGSLAKYNNLMASPITTPGGEVGMPASRANEYYEKSLTAARTILGSSNYQLYRSNPNLGENFYDMLNTKDGNTEVIFVKDYLPILKSHYFAYDNIVRSISEDNESSSALSPSLSLVESFDYLDGTKGTLRYKDANGDYVFYDNLSDIFEGKDARLYGTVIYPGTTFKSTAVNMQAGVYVWDEETGEYRLSVTPTLGANYSDGGLWTGLDGPKDNERDVSNTGFYIRKHVTDAALASTRGTRADNWWPWFRLGEVYLNAAEAAFELGDPTAVNYINTLRERAGFPANSISNLTMDIIRNERRVELAFEDHRYHDLRRWRIAHEVWNGSNDSEDAVVYGLYPYRVVRPGHPDDGKFIYEKIRPDRFRQPRFFRMANYYASIHQNDLNNNPKLVKNPFH
ncbi:MAG: RagB/SusD family nutrient uptake outer membrane protein [Tannerellaceae bacterium]|nr:RagB/SusD family nutrient uptake outer membrane protein [Tannerellaceae bacterium]